MQTSSPSRLKNGSHARRCGSLIVNSMVLRAFEHERRLLGEGLGTELGAFAIARARELGRRFEEEDARLTAPHVVVVVDAADALLRGIRLLEGKKRPIPVRVELVEVLARLVRRRGLGCVGFRQPARPAEKTRE